MERENFASECDQAFMNSISHSFFPLIFYFPPSSSFLFFFFHPKPLFYCSFFSSSKNTSNCSFTVTYRPVEPVPRLKIFSSAFAPPVAYPFPDNKSTSPQMSDEVKRGGKELAVMRDETQCSGMEWKNSPVVVKDVNS